MDFQEHVSLKGKTTMRIGGTARFFCEAFSKEDIEQAVAFAKDQSLPLIVLGGGSNTVFCNEEIAALVMRIKATDVAIDGNTVTAQAGTILAMLINDLAGHGLDLSALTGIPGSLGGALFGNAGQGPTGVWIDSFVESVTAYIDGEWKTLSKEECNYRYRESRFKDQQSNNPTIQQSIIFEATLTVPSGDPETIKAESERLLQKRIETQPHVKTAGSCFKALPDGTPAWQLIDAAGLRGLKVGGIEVSEKHANFLLNTDGGSFEDLTQIVEKIKEGVPQIAGVEMRLFLEDGSLQG